jgi:hypothetical protein
MNELASNENAPADLATSRRRFPKVASKRQPKRRIPREIDVPPVEPQLPRIGTMVRTKRLILAALRVWELKNGIRE